MIYDVETGRTYYPSSKTGQYTVNMGGVNNLVIKGTDGKKTYHPIRNTPKQLPPQFKPFTSPGTGNRGASSRGPVLNMDPKTGQFQIMGTRQGVSLPGYTHSPVSRGTNWLGLASQLPRLNPTIRMTMLAFDIANSIYNSDAWALHPVGEPIPLGYDWSNIPEQYHPAGGFVVCEDPSLDWAGSGGTGWSFWGSTPGGACGSGGHVNYEYGSGPPDLNTGFRIVTQAGRLRWQYQASEMGPIQGDPTLPQARHRMRLKTRATAYYRVDQHPYPEGGWPVPFRYAQARVPMPLMRLEPQPASMTEEKRGDTVRRTPALKPYERPTVGREFNTATGSSSMIPPKTPLAPPRTRDKEKKMQQASGRSLGKLIAALYDATTEAQEVVDILYDNLGKKCKGAGTMSEKANCVYNNLDTLDVPMAMAELVKNHYEDKVFGRIFGTVGKHTDYGAMTPGRTGLEDLGHIRKL